MQLLPLSYKEHNEEVSSVMTARSFIDDLKVSKSLLFMINSV